MTVAATDADGDTVPDGCDNCAAIPKDLIESELFGYEKGAFSGAGAGGKKGLIEEAAGGTLFLDEVGDLSLEAQAKLLRFLESGEVRRVGDNESFTCDVRVVCATHRHLDEMVEDVVRLSREFVRDGDTAWIMKEDKLEIREVEGRAWCMDCSQRVSIGRRGDACPHCGGFGMIVEQGDELLLKELEVI